MTDSNLNDLCRELQPIAKEFLDQCAQSGLKCHITTTWRDPTTQNAAKAAGLSNAAAGQSPHNCCGSDGKPASRSFDFALFSDGEYIKDGKDPRYTQAGDIGKSLGLVYGGDWHHPDWDHLEMSYWKSV